MSSSLNRIKKNIIEAMQSSNNQGTSAYGSDGNDIEAMRKAKAELTDYLIER